MNEQTIIARFANLLTSLASKEQAARVANVMAADDSAFADAARILSVDVAIAMAARDAYKQAIRDMVDDATARRLVAAARDSAAESVARMNLSDDDRRADVMRLVERNAAAAREEANDA